MNSFSQLFESLTGSKPFPWQDALFSRLASGERLPKAVDIPTGLGKTAVMAIWLIARAAGVDLPRRLIYVVDRRVVVDQATAEAEKLRRFVEDNPEIQNALDLEKPLPISTLRGQHLDNREWLEDPSAPAIIIGTVDMIGSRLLFEGYGVSRKMRPYHAGLLGADALVVLDEAHLVPPFEALLESLARRDVRLRPEGGTIPTFRVLSLSATGRQKDTVHTLTDADLAEGTETRKRLTARKTLACKAHDSESDFSAWMAEQAWLLRTKADSPQRIVVFCNLRKDAEKVADAIENTAKQAGEDIVCELLVGARRVRERQEAGERLQDQGWFSGAKNRPEKPMFLVATSAGEVGVDLDADHMVCDLVEWERMVQRLGRVNRRGDGDAGILVLLEKEPEPSAKEKAALDKSEADRDDSERKLVEKFRQKAARIRTLRPPLDLLPDVDEGKDASPLSLRVLRDRSGQDKKVAEALDAATTQPPLRPALSLPLIEAWSMTSLKEHTGRPDIVPWLRGWVEDEAPQTRVAWRVHLPVFADGQPFAAKDVARYFDAAPIHITEVLETRSDEVFSWLTKRAQAFAKPENSGNHPSPDTCIGFLLDASGEPVGKPLSLEDLLLESADKSQKETLKRRLSHHTLVLDARLGGLAPSGLLDTSENDPASCVDGPDPWLDHETSPPIVPFRITTSPPEENDWLPTAKFALDESEGEPATAFLFISKWCEESGDADDQSVTGEQSLQQHQTLAEACMRGIAQRLGLEESLTRVLCLAARIHDEGKNSPRWQDAFNAPSDGRPYAKTRGPINQSRLGGYRHELVSMLRAKKHPEVLLLAKEERELLLHLIAAHHGFARPFIGLDGCDDLPPTKLRGEGVEIACRFARLQKRWGPWGLAWLESLLRAADQQASRNLTSQSTDLPQTQP